MIRRKAWGSYGWREEDIFWLSQLRKSLNPSSVEGFFLSLSTVGLAYGGNLCPEGVLSLNHADVIAMLFGLILFLLRLNLRFLGLIFEPLSFFQLLPQSCQLLLGSSQLVIGLAQESPLSLGLSLCTLQSHISTFSSMLLIGQFFLHLCVALFSNG